MIVLLALLLAAPPLAPAGLPAGADFASSALCGNGRIDTFSGPVICAPCIPNRPCRCEPRSITEECDRADLGGRTCASLGFLGGTLRCTATCRLDRTGCETAAAKPPFAQAATVAEALAGRDFALARRGDVLAVASTETGAVRLRTFDAATLAPRGAETAWRPPATPAPGAFGLAAFENARVDPLWSPALAALGDGFVLAAERAASSAYTIVTFRAPPGGAIGTPVASFPGRHPFFLVPGGDGALLGYWWRGVQVVRVGADARPLGEPLSIEASGTIPPAAAALFTGDGWVVVTAAGAGDRRLRVTRVGLDGGATAASTMDVGPVSSLALAGDVGGVAVYARTGGGVFAVPLPPSGAPGGEPIRVCDGLSVLAAEQRTGHLVVWAGAASRVLRADLRLSDGAPEAAPVLSSPRLVPAAALLDHGAFHLVFTPESGKPALYGAR